MPNLASAYMIKVPKPFLTSTPTPLHPLTPSATIFGSFILLDYNISGLLYWLFLLQKYSCPRELYGNPITYINLCPSATFSMEPNHITILKIAVCRPVQHWSIWASLRWSPHFPHSTTFWYTIYYVIYVFSASLFTGAGISVLFTDVFRMPKAMPDK